LRTKRKEISKLEAENKKLIDFRDQFFKLQKELFEQTAENKSLHIQLSENKSLLQEIKKRREEEISKYKESFDEIDAILLKERQNSKARESNLVSEIGTLEQTIKTQNEKISSLQSENEQLSKKLDFALIQKNELNETTTLVRRREQENEEKLGNAMREISNLENKIQETVLNSEKLKHEISSLYEYQNLYNLEKEKYADLQNQFEKLQIQHSKCKDNEKLYERKIANFEEDYKRLQQKYSGDANLSQKHNKTLSELMDQIKIDKEIIRNLEVENEKLQSNEKELISAINELKMENDKKNSEVKDLENLVDELNKNRENLQETVNKMHDEHEKRKKDLKEFSENKQKLSETRKSEINTLKKLIDNI